MTYRLAKISSKRFFKNLKKGHKIRPIYENTNADDSDLPPHLSAALDELEYAWSHPEDYQWFTDTKEFLRYLENGTNN